MIFLKLSIFFILSITLYANSFEKIVYVENKDKNEISIKDEFFNNNTSKYTLSVGVLTSGKHKPLDFFKRNKLTNAVAYQFGDNLEYIRIISGVYENYKDAKNAINTLNKNLLLNNPYPIKIQRHQKQFRMYNEKSSISTANKINEKKTVIKKVSKNSIYISGSKDSQALKNELLKEDSKLYALSLATLSSSEKGVKNFFKINNISNKALAHVYGKKRDKVRVIYGPFTSYKDAKNAISTFNRDLKQNKPYVMKMKNFNSFYKKYNSIENKEDIVKLKINDNKTEESVAKPKLKDDIKIVQSSEIIKSKEDIKPTKRFVEKVEPKIVKPKKVIKKEVKPKKVFRKPEIVKTPKIVKKIDENKNRYLKHSELVDVYYVETNGNFNILNEVFLNDGSSFFTIDLGELKLSDTSIREFFLENDLNDNALSYKYGVKKEFARTIYGAYETKDAASNAINNLKVQNKNIKVSNIKNHQKLYKTYHENILKRSSTSKSRKSRDSNQEEYQVKTEIKPSSDDISYIDLNNNKSLKDEFFKENSPYYTITLITFHQNDLTLEKFISENYIEDDLLAFSLGSKNDYYRVIYGLFSTSKEALKVIENLDKNLLKNKPYVSKVKTTRKRFESYNNRNISDYRDLATKIELR